MIMYYFFWLEKKKFKYNQNYHNIFAFFWWRGGKLVKLWIVWIIFIHNFFAFCDMQGDNCNYQTILAPNNSSSSWPDNYPLYFAFHIWNETKIYPEYLESICLFWILIFLSFVWITPLLWIGLKSYGFNCNWLICLLSSLVLVCWTNNVFRMHIVPKPKWIYFNYHYS